MHEFIAKHQEKIAGTLSGFDRLVFRGTLRSIAYPEGMNGYLWANQILLKTFGSHVEQVSRQLKQASLARAKELERPVQYLNSSQIDKEKLARGIATKEGSHHGLVRVLSCCRAVLEFLRSITIGKPRSSSLQPRYRKCLFSITTIHPVFGFLNAHIQTWLPFPVQICLNGREWLAQKMQTAGLEFVQQDN